MNTQEVLTQENQIVVIRGEYTVHTTTVHMVGMFQVKAATLPHSLWCLVKLEVVGGGRCLLPVKAACFQFAGTLHMPLHTSHGLPRVHSLGGKACAALASGDNTARTWVQQDQENSRDGQ